MSKKYQKYFSAGFILGVTGCFMGFIGGLLSTRDVPLGPMLMIPAIPLLVVAVLLTAYASWDDKDVK